MNIYLITENAQLYAPQRLIQEAQKLKHKLTLINPRQYLLQSTQLKKKLPSTIVLHRSNGIHFDDFDLALSFSFEARGAKVFNSPHSLLLYRDKLQQSILLSTLGIPMIRWAAERGSSSNSLLREFKNYGPPFVYKTQRGNKGLGVHHLKNIKDLKLLLQDSDQRYLLQTFLDVECELRCFFIGKKLWFLRKDKNSKGTHHFESNNFSLASKLEEKMISSFSKKIIKACGYFYGAVDFLVKNNKVYFLELNANPGFQSIEQLSNDNIAETLLKAMAYELQKK